VEAYLLNSEILSATYWAKFLRLTTAYMIIVFQHFLCFERVSSSSTVTVTNVEKIWDKLAI